MVYDKADQDITKEVERVYLKKVNTFHGEDTWLCVRWQGKEYSVLVG